MPRLEPSIISPGVNAYTNLIREPIKAFNAKNKLLYAAREAFSIQPLLRRDNIPFGEDDVVEKL